MKKITLLCLAIFSLTVSTQLQAQTCTTFDSIDTPGEIDPGATQTADCGNDPNRYEVPLTFLGEVGTDIMIDEVFVDISHTFSGDLSLLLEDDQGNFIFLAENLGGATDDAYNGTIFQDGGADITTATAPFGTGPYAASGGNLNDIFDGVFIDDDITWSLVICDNAGDDTGMVNDFSITFCEIGEPNEAPVITCPEDIATVATTDNCDATVTFNMATATDDSGDAPSVTQTEGPISGSIFPVGVTTVTFEAEDADGLTATCSFTVTVTDEQNPEFILCPDPQTVTADANDMFEIPDYVANGDVTFEDNCTIVGDMTVTQTPTAGTMVALGDTTVTITIEDEAGNMNDCTFDVTVEDNGPLESFTVCNSTQTTIDPDTDFRIPITVNETGVIGDGAGEYRLESVTFDIQHDFAEDIDISLEAPNQPFSIQLVPFVGGEDGLDQRRIITLSDDINGFDYPEIFTWFDAATFEDVFNSSQGIPGSDNQGLLLAYNDESINGDWQMEIFNVDDSVGTFYEVCLNFVLSSTLSVADNELLQDVKMFPNPASDVVRFSEQIDSYTVYNLQGQKVYQGTEQSFNVSALTAGMYFVNITKNGKTGVEKLLVK